MRIAKAMLIKIVAVVPLIIIIIIIKVMRWLLIYQESFERKLELILILPAVEIATGILRLISRPVVYLAIEWPILVGAAQAARGMAMSLLAIIFIMTVMIVIKTLLVSTKKNTALASMIGERGLTLRQTGSIITVHLVAHQLGMSRNMSKRKL